MLIKWYEVDFMTGLIIRSPWIEKILAGEKTWEIRSSNTNVRGPIALIRGGSGLVVGTCDLVDCIGPLTLQEVQENEDKTGIPAELETPDPRFCSCHAVPDLHLGLPSILSGISDFNFMLGQNHTPAALSCQPQIALATIGWQARLVWQFR